jgi:hypothetical protein
MNNAVFAREALKQRVCRCVGGEVFELRTSPLEPSFHLASFPQEHTASPIGRRGLQCDTNPKHVKA